MQSRRLFCVETITRSLSTWVVMASDGLWYVAATLTASALMASRSTALSPVGCGRQA